MPCSNSSTKSTLLSNLSSKIGIHHELVITFNILTHEMSRTWKCVPLRRHSSIQGPEAGIPYPKWRRIPGPIRSNCLERHHAPKDQAFVTCRHNAETSQDHFALTIRFAVPPTMAARLERRLSKRPIRPSSPSSCPLNAEGLKKAARMNGRLVRGRRISHPAQWRFF